MTENALEPAKTRAGLKNASLAPGWIPATQVSVSHQPGRPA
jgi:hypothetical protein